MKSLTLSVIALVAALVSLQSLAADGGETKVYAHYMGCWPISHGNFLPGVDEELKDALHRGVYKGFSQQGGRFRNFPLVPQDYKADEYEAAKVEIRRAIRAGIDGFAFDAWSGDRSPQTLDIFFKAAEDMKVDFGLTICLDPSCHVAKWLGDGELWEKFVVSAKWVLRHIDSPNLARFNGKPLFFGYYSGSIRCRQKDTTMEQYRAYAKIDWKKWREALPCPVFLHGSVEGYGEWRGNNRTKAEDLPAIVKDMAETYDAVGMFLGGKDHRWLEDLDVWKSVKAAGIEWSQPLCVQYNNKGGGIISEAGFDLLRGTWTKAIERGCRLLQFVTWNDYGEESVLAPGYGSGYAVMRLNRYYADWLKSGKPPKVEKDEIHVSFRRAPADALTFPFLDRRVGVPSVLEVVTFLTAPGKVHVEGYGDYDAPAGMSYRQFEEKPGKVAVTVTRRNWLFANREVCRLDCPEEIGAYKWRESNVMATWSSTYDEEWELDFPGVKPLHYSENGDVDGDGLPNWFEMVYFGKYPFMETAGIADPLADPDGDGFTNIEEYRNETDPNIKDVPYAKGHVWSLAELKGHEYVSNPARDGKGRYVWCAEIALGARGAAFNPLAKFTEIYSGGGSLKRKKFRFYEENPLGGDGFDSGVAFDVNGSGKAEVFVRKDCPIAIAWIAPVDGVVDVESVWRPKNHKINEIACHIVKDGTVIGDGSAKGVAVKKGDAIRLVAVNGYRYSSGEFLTIESLKVTLR